MGIPDIAFQDDSPAPAPPVAQLAEQETDAAPQVKYPPAILEISDETKDKFLSWLDTWLQDLVSSQNENQDAWAEIEEAYRALPGSMSSISSPPFQGGCMDIIPVQRMAVDPIHARLDTGIFKQDPVFSVKGLQADTTKFASSLEKFIDAYQKHVLHLRRIGSPRLLEMVKLGTMVFKTVYDQETSKSKGYDQEFKVVEKTTLKFRGPRVLGISLGDFLFPPNYQDVQDCPIIAERQRTTFEKLKLLEADHKLANVDKIKGQDNTVTRTPLEREREEGVKNKPSVRTNELVVYECWCDYDIDGDGLPEHIVVTYHYDTRTIIQLRYNWYFHQKKPYTVVPYMITNESLLGMGVGEVTSPFQKAVTRFHRMASDNAYLANIRMFIGKKGSGLEEIPRLFTGKVFFVDDPTKDFIPFAGGDIYPSTLTERSNLFGMVEKATGLSDYLVGRESPIIGTRATATSTLALIQEGARRVEEVLENIRNGFSEIIEFCLSIWVQYGTDGIEDRFFGNDAIAQDVKAFFAMASQQNVNALIGVELTATDASTTRVAQQQMQLGIIQIMMMYLEKVLAAGQAALQAQQTMPQLTEMIKEVMRAARAMFTDLVKKYDIRNPEDYLPDLEKFLQPQGGNGGPQSVGPGAAGGVGGGAAGPGGLPALPIATGPGRAAAIPGPATPGSGGRYGSPASIAG
jgi:hypothetical protein